MKSDLSNDNMSVKGCNWHNLLAYLCVCSVTLFMSDSAVPWTVACHTPLLMEFFKQEYGVGCHFLLQGIFLIQGSNPCLLSSRRFFTSEPPGKPYLLNNYIVVICNYYIKLLCYILIILICIINDSILRYIAIVLLLTLIYYNYYIIINN
jgi:hypothetical protein